MILLLITSCSRNAKTEDTVEIKDPHDVWITDPSEKVVLLATIMAVDPDTMNNILHHYDLRTAYDTAATIQEALDEIATRFRISPKATARIIFANHYQMFTYDEIGEYYMETYLEEEQERAYDEYEEDRWDRY